VIGQKRPNYPPADGLILAEKLINRPHILLGPVDRVGVKCGSGDVGGGRGGNAAVAERGGRGAEDWGGERGVTATEENGGVTEFDGAGGERRGKREKI
jgi:hypothetical protein